MLLMCIYIQNIYIYIYIYIYIIFTETTKSENGGWFNTEEHFFITDLKNQLPSLLNETKFIFLHVIKKKTIQYRKKSSSKINKGISK